MKSVLEQGLSMNSHSSERSLKRSSNVERAENIRSSHVVKCECKLRHIPNDFAYVLCKNGRTNWDAIWGSRFTLAQRTMYHIRWAPPGKHEWTMWAVATTTATTCILLLEVWVGRAKGHLACINVLQLIICYLFLFWRPSPTWINSRKKAV